MLQMLGLGVKRSYIFSSPVQNVTIFIKSKSERMYKILICFILLTTILCVFLMCFILCHMKELLVCMVFPKFPDILGLSCILYSITGSLFQLSLTNTTSTVEVS